MDVSPRIPGAVGGGLTGGTSKRAAMGVSFVVGNIVVFITAQGAVSAAQVERIAEAQYRLLVSPTA